MGIASPRDNIEARTGGSSSTVDLEAGVECDDDVAQDLAQVHLVHHRLARLGAGTGEHGDDVGRVLTEGQPCRTSTSTPHR